MKRNQYLINTVTPQATAANIPKQTKRHGTRSRSQRSAGRDAKPTPAAHMPSPNSPRYQVAALAATLGTTRVNPPPSANAASTVAPAPQRRQMGSRKNGKKK